MKLDVLATSLGTDNILYTNYKLKNKLFNNYLKKIIIVLELERPPHLFLTN